MNEAYADMVRFLAKPGKKIIEDLTPERAHLWHMASCVQGEAGELFDAIKKPCIYGKSTFDRDNIVEELGDIEFYLEGLRQGLKISREETILANMEKLGKRYHEGKFSNEQAQARADKNESER